MSWCRCRWLQVRPVTGSTSVMREQVVHPRVRRRSPARPRPGSGDSTSPPTSMRRSGKSAGPCRAAGRRPPARRGSSGTAEQQRHAAVGQAVQRLVRRHHAEHRGSRRRPAGRPATSSCTDAVARELMLTCMRSVGRSSSRSTAASAPSAGHSRHLVPGQPDLGRLAGGAGGPGRQVARDVGAEEVLGLPDQVAPSP